MMTKFENVDIETDEDFQEIGEAFYLHLADSDIDRISALLIDARNNTLNQNASYLYGKSLFNFEKSVKLLREKRKKFSGDDDDGLA